MDNNGLPTTKPPESKTDVRLRELIDAARDQAFRFEPREERPDPAEVPVLPLGETIDGFHIVRELGRGGMGVVYEAVQQIPLRRVALKVIHNRLLTEPAKRRFRLEANILAKLSHPGIAAVFGAGVFSTVIGELPYLTMEYVDGVSLAEYVAQRGAALTSRDRLQLIADLCVALQHVHEQGVLHRDIKPANIRLQQDGRSKLLDFGLACTVDADDLTTMHTENGKPLGTFRYMSPEQALGDLDGLDFRTDVYSLGVVAYELLAGRPPYRPANKSPTAIIRAICEIEPDPLSTREKRFHRDVETMVGKALRKDRSRRYTSAAAFGDDIRRFLAGEPIDARPSALWERFVRATKRRATAVLGVAASVLLLVAIGVWWSSRSVSRQLDSVRNTVTSHAQQREQAERKAQAAEQRTTAAESDRDRQAYTAVLSQAFSHLESGDSRLAEKLLLETDPNLRGWEWHYMRRLTDPSDDRLAIDEDSRFAAYLPDQDALLVGSKRWVKIHERGQELGAPLVLGDGELSAFAFDTETDRLAVCWKKADGRRTSGVFEGPQIWDVADRKRLLSFAKVTSRDDRAPTHADCAAWRPGGNTVLTGGTYVRNGQLQLWNTDTGRDSANYQGQLFGIVLVAVSPDGERIVTVSKLGEIKVWDWSGDDPKFAMVLESSAGGNSEERVQEFTIEDSSVPGGVRAAVSNAGEGEVGAIAIDPDSRLVAAGYFTGELAVWALEDGRERFRVKAHVSPITALAFHPESTHLLSGGRDGKLAWWDTEGGRALRKLSAHAGAVRGITFSPAETITIGDDRLAKFWFAGASPQHRNPVLAVAVHPDGDRLYSQTADRRLRTWEATGAVAGEFAYDQNLLYAVRQAAIGPISERFIVSGGGDSRLHVRDLKTGELIGRLTGSNQEVVGLALSPDESLVAAARLDGAVQLWKVPANPSDPAPKPVTLAEVDATALVWNIDGQGILVGSSTGAVAVYNAQTGAKFRTFRGCSGRIAALAVDPLFERLAALDDAGFVRVWLLEGEFPLWSAPQSGGAARAVAFSPDGGRLAVGDASGTITLYAAAEGTPIITLPGHSAPVNALAFSLDGKCLVTGSDDRTLRIWDTNLAAVALLATEDGRQRLRNSLTAAFHSGQPREIDSIAMLQEHYKVLQHQGNAKRFAIAGRETDPRCRAAALALQAEDEAIPDNLTSVRERIGDKSPLVKYWAQRALEELTSDKRSK